MVVPCFTHMNAEPILGTNCLRYVTITNRKYNEELQKFTEKLARKKLHTNASQMDDAIDLVNKKLES